VIRIRADFSVPASWPRNKRDAALAGVIRPTGRPDFDNICKMVDALNGIVWLDDTQVVDARVEKHYSERACLTVCVEELEIWTGASTASVAEKDHAATGMAGQR
jgi:Holliday junction resolvase RusA-like endonuclease